MFMPTVSENEDSKETKKKVMKEVDFITLAYIYVFYSLFCSVASQNVVTAFVPFFIKQVQKNEQEEGKTDPLKRLITEQICSFLFVIYMTVYCNRKKSKMPA